MLRKDRIERHVARNAFERNMRNRLAAKRRLPFQVTAWIGQPRAVRVSIDILRSAFAELIRQKTRGHYSLPRQRQRYPAGVNGDPTPTPLLGDVSRSTAATGSVEDEIPRIAGHQETALKHFSAV